MWINEQYPSLSNQGKKKLSLSCLGICTLTRSCYENLWKTDTAAVTTRRLLSLWPCLERVTDTYWAVKLRYYKDFIYLTESRLSDKEELSSFPLKRQVTAIVIVKELGLSTLSSLIHCIRNILLKDSKENPRRKRKWINILLFPWFIMYHLHVLPLRAKDVYYVSQISQARLLKIICNISTKKFK